MSNIKSKSNYFELIDFFGGELTFNTFGSKKATSMFGATMSFICIGIVIVISILFGSDFYNKTNPRIIIEEKKHNGEKNRQSSAINASNFGLAFMFRSMRSKLTHMYFADDKHTDTKNLFYYIDIVASHSVITYKKNGKMENNSKQINLVKCDETLLPNDITKNEFDYDNWLCLPFNEQENKEFKIGHQDGSLESDINYTVYYFNLNLRNRKLSDNEYVDMNEVEKYIKSDFIYFQYMIPHINFLPNNIDSPFLINYNKILYVLKTSLVGIDRFNAYYHKMYDDQGWIFKDIKETKLLGVEKQDVDYDLLEFRSLPKIKYNLFTFLFTLSYDSYIYNRNYMKIQELAALVGGFMKLIFLTCQILVTPYNIFNTKYNLVDMYCVSSKNSNNIKELLNFKELKLNVVKNNFVNSYNKKDTLNVNNSIINDNSKLNFNIIDFNSPAKNKINSINQPINKTKINNNNSNNNISNNNSNKNIKNISNNLCKEKQQSIVNLKNKKEIAQLYQNIKYNISINKNNNREKNLINNSFDISSVKYFYYYILCACKYKKNNSANNNSNIPEKYKNFNNVYTMLTKVLDITSFIKLNRQYNVLKNIVLSSEESQALNYIDKFEIDFNSNNNNSNIYNNYFTFEDSNIDQDIDFNNVYSIINYFVNKKQSKNLNDKDNKLFKQLKQELKLTINEIDK